MCESVVQTEMAWILKTANYSVATFSNAFSLRYYDDVYGSKEKLMLSEHENTYNQCSSTITCQKIICI